MKNRLFGGHTIAQLSSLKRNSADGGKYYLALQEAAEDLFALAIEHEKLSDAVVKLVMAANSVIWLHNDAAMPPGPKPAIGKLSEILDQPALRKFTGP